ncbi:DUF2226 domain-containing protein [Methanothermobacter tenebrarum]|uniref:DUF2226 domain-containing protein n=1 Tax=Methanothermobacter tenebrarum TaxID=680118 RepID=A0A328PAL2_9EURY|nr:DUF2226 domain-containing protein [Methanothermobacter tenebrarum]RAO79737.1 hypothetical protein DPC56_00135 [Methanothermobacter tenebrarum]
MELPITRPTYISYGDELDFNKFLEKLARKKHNGFIRVTHASSEGHILIKDGIPIAASYDRYMKSKAMEKILEIINKMDTIIELFEVRESQIDYIIDINKVYKLEPTPPKIEKPTPTTEEKERPKITPVKEKPTPTTEEIPTEPETPEITEETEKIEKPLNREEVMKKYGLKDIDEEEVEKVLENYKGGAITTIDIERVELTLMNKIKKSIIGIPDIKSVEVMVFLENLPELEGDIKVLIERESKGLLSRLMGGAMKEEELKEHVNDIIEMEIKRTFRGYPKIIENFNVNIEIH